MNRSRKLWVVLLLVVGLASLMASMVNAKQASGLRSATKPRITLKRQSSDVKPSAPSPFGRQLQRSQPSFLNKVDSCSGSCSCSSCSCSGSFDCCLGGCMACWDYRDGQGLCSAQ